MPEKPKNLFRALDVDRSKIDENKRTVELAFSSETPVERWWGENEILSHSKGDFDLTRLNDGAPLLLNHDTDQQIGVVESSRIDSDKIGRAVVRFGNSPLANEIFQDVKDGIRKKVSFGYEHTGLIKSVKKDGCNPDAYYGWRAHEITITPVPADNSVGVGRSKDVARIDSAQKADVETIAKNLTNEEKMKLRTLLLDAAPADRTDTGGTSAVAKAITVERVRAIGKEIVTAADALIGDHPHCATKIRSMVNDSLFGGKDVTETTLGEFQIRAMKEVLGAKPAKVISMEEMGMDEDEQRAYSVARGIASCLRRNASTPDGLEGEVHTALVKRTGMECEGFAVPVNARVRSRMGRRMQRDLNVGSFGQGGATVATNVLTPIIELFRNRMVTARLGVQVMGGLEGNVAIPRQTGAATAYSLAESATLTKSTQALDQILLSPHRVGATNDYTRQLLLQSAIDPQNFIMDDLMKVVALKWDYLILNGSGGGSEPTGIINTAGIGSVNFGAAATFAKLVAFETALAVLNADGGNMAYVTSPSARGTLKAAAKTLVGATTVSAVTLWEKGSVPGEGEVNGYLALATNQVLNNMMIFGNWEDAINGLYGGYDVIVNPYSRDVDAAVRVTVNTFGDVAIRHAASFCASADAANQ